MIRFIQPIASGNAIRILLEPSAGASRWRVLRKDADTFSGYDDPQAVVVHDGDERSVVDDSLVMNDVAYFYRVYSLVGISWVASQTATGMATATYRDASTDVLSVIRDRLDLGLRVEVGRNAIFHDAGAVPVLTAPPTFEDTRWPCVTVHLTEESPQARSIGEEFLPDAFDGDDEWEQFEGWLASVQIQIVGWALNADARIEIRKAIRRVLIANMSVFDAHGMIQVAFSMQDVEDFTSYSAPVYQSMCTLSCLAPIVVGTGTFGPVSEVTSEILEEV